MCMKEFQVKYFGFSDCKPEQFYKSQWTEKRWVFWMVKFVLLAYWFAMFVFGLVLSTERHRWWIYLTNWGLVTNLLYLFGTFALATYGLIDNNVSAEPSQVNTKSEQMKPKAEQHATSNEELRWFHKIVWILQVVAFSSAISITLIYWTALYSSGSFISFYNAHSHLLNTVVLLIDLLVSNVPTRLLHFYFYSIFAIVYTIFTLIVHGSGFESSIYPILNWSEQPGLSAGICLGIVFVACPIAQAILFGLYHLRFYIARKTVLKVNATTDTQKGEENAGFQQ